MPVAKTFSAQLPNRQTVRVVILTLADGRQVARTVDEIQTLPPEEQAAALAALQAAPAPAVES